MVILDTNYMETGFAILHTQSELTYLPRKRKQGGIFFLCPVRLLKFYLNFLLTASETLSVNHISIKQYIAVIKLNYCAVAFIMQ